MGKRRTVINLLESIWKKGTRVKIMSYEEGMKSLLMVSLKGNIFSVHICSVSFDI